MVIKRLTEKSVLSLAYCIIILGVCGSWLCLAKELEGDADLAQDLTNPLADLVTIPIQINYDENIGFEDEGTRITTTLQPVIPFDLGTDWLLITRTILPIISQDDIFPGYGSESGLSDLNTTLFLSPVAPDGKGFMWGAGPVFVFPTATEDLLGNEKWSAGPAAVFIAMGEQLTFGMLMNHVWSYAGADDRADVNNSFIQPFIAYVTESAWTISLQSETSYNWETEEWAVPVNVGFSKLVWLGNLPVNLQAGMGYWLDSPDSGAEGWRFRLQANFVLPRFF